jgi:hypothetical protein
MNLWGAITRVQNAGMLSPFVLIGGTTMSLMYFTDAEVMGLIPPLPEMLDHLRGYLGLPVRLTFTTGGQHCGHSAHYKGMAADCGLGHLAAGFERDTYRYKFINAAYSAGFKRIEDCPSHVHLDVGEAPDYATPVMILGAEA